MGVVGVAWPFDSEASEPPLTTALVAVACVPPLLFVPVVFSIIHGRAKKAAACAQTGDVYA